MWKQGKHVGREMHRLPQLAAQDINDYVFHRLIHNVSLRC
jgi:hypothetical protein